MWGSSIPLGDCEAQEVTIGEFHFTAIDYGDTILASEVLKRETKNIDSTECNQCVLLHLVAGLQWVRMQRQQGIPEKRKVLLEVEEWRMEEIVQAKEALKWCDVREDPISKELGRLAHDVVNVGHDRDYRGIAVFFHEILRIHKANVRVFDLRVREAGGYELRISYFQTPGGEEWPMVDLLASQHHMRWLKPCVGILASVKRDWKCIFKAHLQVFAVEGWKTK